MSRDLDVKIAENIMGWKWVATRPTGKTCLLPPDFDISTSIEDAFGDERVAPFSTSISEAMYVIDALRASGFGVNIHTVDDGWTVFFQSPGGDADFLGGVRCKTLAEAICRAALVVKGME